MQTASTIDSSVALHSQPELIKDSILRIRSAHEELDPAQDHPDSHRTGDRRECRRARLQIPAIVVPVDLDEHRPDVATICGGEQIAVTRDISLLGIGLVHDEPLASDHLLLQFDIPGEEPVSLLLQVRWTKRTGRYSHCSGGRIVSVAAPAAP
jgi:hypothetical protein